MVDLALDVIFTVSYKYNFTDIFKGMKTMKKQKIFRIDHSGNTDSKTVEFIFSDAVRIYDSELLLKKCVCIDNADSYLNLECWIYGVSYYQ